MDLGPFEILSTIGEGDEATVYRARHRTLGREVVLKHLNHKLEPGEPSYELFRQEADALARVRSEHIATFYSYQFIDGRPLLEWEWLDGGSLEDVIAEAPLALEAALQLVLDLLSGLKAIHAAGIVHHAVKPSNVMRDDRGRFKLTDPRLSIMQGEEFSTLQAASVYYAEPERLSGPGFDARSDLYSVGMIAYRAILGAAGFRDAFPELMPMAVFGSKWLGWLRDPARVAPPLHQLRAHVPVAISQFVARLMAKDPESRFASADAALAALTPLLQLVGRTPRSARPLPPPPPAAPARRPAPPAPAVSRAMAAPQRREFLSPTIYFMTLVGGLAGLMCWATTVSIGDLLTVRQESTWLLLTLWTTIMGALVGGMTVGFADTWSADRLLWRWVASGTLLGATAGVMAGLVYVPVQQTVVAMGGEGVGDLVARISLWTIAGGLIGLVTGLRSYTLNPYRALHAMAGGVVGGTLGGIVFRYTSGSHEFFAALAFILTGMGISLGVTLAPVLLRSGVLQFVASGAPEAEQKYGPSRQEWSIQPGDRLIIGSEGVLESATMYARNIHVFVPDVRVAARHAIFYERDKRFYVRPHPDNVGPDGLPGATLKVGDSSVVEPREIHDGDELLIGQTSFRFYMARRKGAPEEALPLMRSTTR